MIDDRLSSAGTVVPPSILVSHEFDVLVQSCHIGCWRCRAVNRFANSKNCVNRRDLLSPMIFTNQRETPAVIPPTALTRRSIFQDGKDELSTFCLLDCDLFVHNRTIFPSIPLGTGC